MLRLFLALLALLGAASTAQGDVPPPFFLDLDTGGHRAAVRDVAWTPDGRTLVSASDDKTIRVWDAEDGTPLRTVRGQIGPGNEGKVFSIAISPDGKTVAAGGWFGPGLGETPPYGDVRLFDLSTGRMKGVLKKAEFPLYGLAFSPDGQRLAAAGQDGLVFLWRRNDAQAGGWAFERELDAESGSILRVAFALGGRRLAAATEDAGLRLWNLDTGERLAGAEEDETWADRPLRALGVSADGQAFAVGSDGGRAAVFRAGDGMLVGELPRRTFAIGSVLLAGDRIIVTCGHDCADRNRTEIWRLGDTEPAGQYREHDRIVFAGAVSPDGKLVATAGGTRHTIRLWNPQTAGTHAVLQGAGFPVMAVGIDPKRQAIAWGAQNPCPAEVTCPATTGLLENTLLLPTADRFFEAPEALEGDDAVFLRAIFAQEPWSLQAEAGGDQGLGDAMLVVSKDGRPLHRLTRTADDGARHAAFTLLDRGSHFITGDNDGALLEYDSATGKLLGAFSGGHSGAIEALAVSEKLNLMVSGSADQTIGLWNLATRELIVSMFFAGPEWVVWMPQGFYTSSDDGDKLIGWHVNQGQDAEGRFIRAGQLKRYLWSPEMVRRAITLHSASAALREMRPGTDRALEELVRRKPPEFSLRVADDQTRVRDGFLAVEISGQEDGAGQALSILSNSRNVGAAISRTVSGDGTRTVLEVPVEAGTNRVSITATDAFGYLTERSVVALVRNKAEPKKGRLFVAAIGVDEYPFLPDACNGRSCNLRFPVDDAAGFLATVAEKTAPMFSGMETLFLVNREALEAEPAQARAVARFLHAGGAEPDSDTISDALADFLDRPGPDDTTLVFVAGHGINLDEDYYFVPTDARKTDGERWKRSTLVDWADIQKAVERAEGTRVMVLDTCHAANAFNPRLEKDAADARIVVLSAAAANNTAAELPELGHGVFTYSLLEGLRGKAASPEGVRLLGLADFLDREVERLTNKRQKPFFYISNMENIQLAAP